MSTSLTITVTELRAGLFAARLADRLLCVSRDPFCGAARALLADGHLLGDVLVMRHAGSLTDALTATLGVAAKLTVAEDRGAPRHRPWKAWQPREDRPGIDEITISELEAELSEQVDAGLYTRDEAVQKLAAAASGQVPGVRP